MSYFFNGKFGSGVIIYYFCRILIKISVYNMQKIMFNDKYRLTQAVLEGRKTQTRRIFNLSDKKGNTYEGELTDEYKKACIRQCSRYKIGEVVAIAQKYSDIENLPFTREFDIEKGGKIGAGWGNKMFVEAIYMQHHIRITNVRLERLQDISYEDCLAEGIEACGYDYEGREIYSFRYGDKWYEGYRTEKEAYAELIDKVGKKGTWKSNPWVFAYEFILID